MHLATRVVLASEADNMARKRKTLAETLASKSGVSAAALSRKIATVKREDPSLTNRQAAGKAAGILRQRKVAARVRKRKVAARVRQRRRKR